MAGRDNVQFRKLVNTLFEEGVISELLSYRRDDIHGSDMPPHFIAHMYLDGNEYLLTLIPTALEGNVNIDRRNKEAPGTLRSGPAGKS